MACYVVQNWCARWHVGCFLGNFVRWPIRCKGLVTGDEELGAQENLGVSGPHGGGWYRMNATDLVSKLMALELVIGKADAIALRGIVFEAEDAASKVESRMEELMRESEVLKEDVEGFRKLSLEIVAFRPGSEGHAGATELPSLPLILRIARGIGVSDKRFDTRSYVAERRRMNVTTRMPITIATTLLVKLREISEAVGRGDPSVVPSIVLEAEDCVLQMERELMVSFKENERLRRPA